MDRSHPRILLWSITILFDTNGGLPHQTSATACRHRQTMNHFVNTCPLTKCTGGLARLHEADGNADNWLKTVATTALGLHGMKSAYTWRASAWLRTECRLCATLQWPWQDSCRVEPFQQTAGSQTVLTWLKQAAVYRMACISCSARSLFSALLQLPQQKVAIFSISHLYQRPLKFKHNILWENRVQKKLSTDFQHFYWHTLWKIWD